MLKKYLFRKFYRYFHHGKDSLQWVVLAVIIGITVGLVGTAFYHCMNLVTQVRMDHPWLIFLLPAAGLLIVWLYHIHNGKAELSTNLVLSAVHSGDNIPLRMAPLIFTTTLITHLFGGSAGREGAALQLGGSIANGFAKLFRVKASQQNIIIMCGMSAAFSAVFGTPLAAAVFAMEVVSVGIMQYSALLPCVIAALLAHLVATHLGACAETFVVSDIPDFGLIPAGQITVLAILCGIVSIFFCVMLHKSGQYFQTWFQNPYLRVLVGGCSILLLTLLVGNQNYNGTGMSLIQSCFEGSTPTFAFLLKMVFTAITLAAGYKGGEIVPSFCIGATLGCLAGNLLGLSPSLCAAVGMGAVFCGVTNSPLASLLICFELFGFEGMPYYLLAIAISYVVSGYYGLYQSQKIIYSKYKNAYTNRKTM